MSKLSKLKKQGLLPSVAVGTGAALVLTALLCLPFAAAVCKGALPLETGFLWAALSAGLSVLLSSLAVARARARQSLPTGAAIAGAYTLLAALICALGGQGFVFGSWLLWLAGAVFLGGLLGAVMSIRQNPHGKRRKQR